MHRRILSPYIATIRDWYLNRDCSMAELCRREGIKRTTLYQYIKEFDELQKTNPEKLRRISYIRPARRHRLPNPNYTDLVNILPLLLARSEAKKNTPTLIYSVYREQYPEGYTFDGFRRIYKLWLKEHNTCVYGHQGVKQISEADNKILTAWRRGTDLEKWRKAVVIQGSASGIKLTQLREKTEVVMKTIQNWIGNYKEKGIAGLIRKPMSIAPWVKQKEEKNTNLMKLLHEPPQAHGYNRAAWRLADLSEAYFEQYGKKMAPTTIRMYIKKSGFRFRKAKMVLTSPDPKFREKLDHIKHILKNLQPDEKFFSMDEFGPFAIKMKPGWSYMPQNEIKLVPQIQKSKGWLICTAAIELSANQVTHFYSPAKNSDEMIKLIDLLLEQYKGQKKLYISGDTASWHSSAKLKNHIERVNDNAKSNANQTPFVELAHLPASSQFLNVIESVFSGLAKSVIHNSDYASVEDCKAAIDRHFKQRNEYFIKNPKRAGKKIWGNEIVKPVFDETQNCKDKRGAVWV